MDINKFFTHEAVTKFHCPIKIALLFQLPSHLLSLPYLGRVRPCDPGQQTGPDNWNKIIDFSGTSKFCNYLINFLEKNLAHL